MLIEYFIVKISLHYLVLTDRVGAYIGLETSADACYHKCLSDLLYGTMVGLQCSCDPFIWASLDFKTLCHGMTVLKCSQLSRLMVTVNLPVDHTCDGRSPNVL